MHTPTFTLADVAAWAKTAGGSSDALYELRKVPARLGMQDDDIGLIPADLRHFEARIAPSSYAPVARSGDVEAKRRRGNSRLRALLRRFFAEGSAQPEASAHRAGWDALIDYIAANEGFVDRGARFATGASRALTMLRARAACGPAAFAQEEIERIALTLTGVKRKSLRKAIRRINTLCADRAAHPSIAHLLPAAPLASPKPADRAPKTDWESLPPSFLRSVDLAIERALQTVADQAREAQARLAAGEDRGVVLADFNARRTRSLGNRAAATEGYRGGIAFAVRGAALCGADIARLSDLRDVLARAPIEAAIADHVGRAAASATMKPAEASQTLHNRLTALSTLARHGLRDAGLAEDIALIEAAHHQVMHRPGAGGMPEERRAFCAMLIRAPHVAANLVNAPERIAAVAEHRLAEAVAQGSAQRQLSALRLYAAAVLFAVQMSRPLRTSNLIRTRIAGVVGSPHRVIWLDKGQRAEIHYPELEVKNEGAITVSLTGGDAAVLRRWTEDLRARHIALSRIADGPYLIPGAAVPRLPKDGLALPRGCVAASTIAEIWAAGADVIGIAMTPHMSRHAVATLILAIEPGAFAKAATVLGDTEDTVRRHYGHEDGTRAAAEVRKALLASHPALLQSMRRKIA